MNVKTAELGHDYVVKRIKLNDTQMLAFLFSLGCYEDEPIAVVSRRRGGCVVAIKDGRYHVDDRLAEAIELYE